MPRSGQDREEASVRSQRFATTQWSLVVAAGQRGGSRAQAALTRLCELYWYPVYAFLRRSGHRADEAEDLTQGFFARIVEKNPLRDADEQRGRFRSYLLTCLQCYVANERDRARALKRGGGVRTLPFDANDAEQRYGREPAHAITPEKLYERRWALTLLETVLGRLRQERQMQGQERAFDRLKDFIGGASPGMDYAHAASELNMTPTAVKVAVHRLRRQYARILRDEIAQTVASPDDVEKEIRHLMAALSI